MKKIIIFLFIIIGFASCDKVSNPVVPKPSVVDTVLCTAPTFTTTPSAIKKVLVEDYTGHTCGNCPDAGIELDKMVEEFQDSIIPISIHAGYFAEVGAAPYTYEFRTSTGNEYHDFFAVPGYPAGMINRIDYNNSTLDHFKSFTEWKALTSAQLRLAPQATIRIINDYKSNEGKVCIYVKTDFLTPMTGNYRLVVLVTEDSIIKPQKKYQPTSHDDLNYIHKHVLRANVNGTWGTEIVAGSTAPSSTVSGFTLTLNPEWNTFKTHIVAYLYDVANYNVLQVEEKKIR